MWLPDLLNVCVGDLVQDAVSDHDLVNVRESVGECDGVGRDRVYVTVGADGVAETVGGESVAEALEEIVSVRVQVVVARGVHEGLWVREGSEGLAVVECVALRRDGDSVRLNDSEWRREAETELERVMEREQERVRDSVPDLVRLCEGDTDGPVGDGEAEGLVEADVVRDGLRLSDGVGVPLHKVLQLRLDDLVGDMLSVGGLGEGGEELL